MPTAERTISIRRPVDQVFRFLADGRTATQWRSGVIDVSKLSGDGLGAVYKQQVRGPGGRAIDADYEITAFEPGQLIAFRAIPGPVRPTGSFAFEAMGDATILTFTLAAELSGWKRLVMGRPVQSTMDAEMAALDRLQEILER
ncbi:MAG: SRPBCC family protein [Frankiaceae bacterium]|nr:SRPBCC family protein [Frankiaceae bacterium]